MVVARNLFSFCWVRLWGGGGALLAAPSQISNLAFDRPLFDLGYFIVIFLFLIVV